MKTLQADSRFDSRFDSTFDENAANATTYHTVNTRTAPQTAPLDAVRTETLCGAHEGACVFLASGKYCAVCTQRGQNCPCCFDLGCWGALGWSSFSSPVNSEFCDNPLAELDTTCNERVSDRGWYLISAENPTVPRSVLLRVARSEMTPSKDFYFCRN